MAGSEEGNRIIITVLGHDRVGIIAGIATILAEAGINILDISQTILQGYFTIVKVADISGSTMDIPQLREVLNEKGLEIDLQITVQHEDIFNFMHRI